MTEEVISLGRWPDYIQKACVASDAGRRLGQAEAKSQRQTSAIHGRNPPPFVQTL